MELQTEEEFIEENLNIFIKKNFYLDGKLIGKGKCEKCGKEFKENEKCFFQFSLPIECKECAVDWQRSYLKALYDIFVRKEEETNKKILEIEIRVLEKMLKEKQEEKKN